MSGKTDGELRAIVSYYVRLKAWGSTELLKAEAELKRRDTLRIHAEIGSPHGDHYYYRTR